MPNNHARRNRLLLALFFGVLSVLFGSTAANATGSWTTCPDDSPMGASYSYQLGSSYTAGQIVDPLPVVDGATLTAAGVDTQYAYAVELPTGGPVCDIAAGYRAVTVSTASGSGAGSSHDVDPPTTTGQVEVVLINVDSSFGLVSPDAVPVTVPTAYTPPPPPPTSSGTDPLGGQGFILVDKSVSVFTTYIVPTIVLLIIAVYVWKMTVKLGTRFLNRA